MRGQMSCSDSCCGHSVFSYAMFKDSQSWIADLFGIRKFFLPLVSLDQSNQYWHP